MRKQRCSKINLLGPADAGCFASRPSPSSAVDDVMVVIIEKQFVGANGYATRPGRSRCRRAAAFMCKLEPAVVFASGSCVRMNRVEVGRLCPIGTSSRAGESGSQGCRAIGPPVATR